jgi:hypothetical protein
VQNLSGDSVSTAVCCDVSAYGSAWATGDELAALRPQVAGLLGKTMPSGWLKHADDQTIVTLVALSRAMAQCGLADACTEWGVVAAPRFLGRVTTAASLERFAAEGAWGVSPHLIPHRSLHSISGTISQALGIRGPNFGVGGGPACASQAFLVVAALLASARLPGVWLSLSGWDPEPERTTPGSRTFTSGTCGAVVLAMHPAQAGRSGLRFRIAPADEVSAPTEILSLERLLESLADGEPPTAAAWRLDGGGRVEMERVEAGVSVLARRLAG